MPHKVTQAARLSALAAAVALAAPALAQKAGEPFTERISGTTVTFNMVPVPAGELEVADPAAPDKKMKVQIAPLWIGTHEVTWDQFDVFVYRLDLPEGERGAPQSRSEPGADAATRPTKPYLPPDRGYGHSGYPAITMSYFSATEYCRWLSEKTGKRYRLPTEAEWEYAARAGANDAPKVADVAWTLQDPGDATHPVGKKAPNAWGLFDTLGNVAEWCKVPEGEKPVARGGSFREEPQDVGFHTRHPQTPAWNASDPQIPKSRWWLADCNFVGFRIVCEGPNPQAIPQSKPETKPAGGAK